MRIQELVFKSELIWDFKSILLYLKASFLREHCHKSTLSSVLVLAHSVTPLGGTSAGAPLPAARTQPALSTWESKSSQGMGATASPDMAMKDNNLAQFLPRVNHFKRSWGEAQFRQNIPKSPQDLTGERQNNPSS